MPNPGRVDLRRVRLAALDVGRAMFRVHHQGHAATALNTSGRGDTRFAPIPGHGHLYVADTQTVALLETSFHDVHQAFDRVVYTATDLVGRALAGVEVVDRVTLADLRDPQLGRLGLTRDQLITTPAEHYPCTREWARTLVGRTVGRETVEGILSNSRVAELAQQDSVLLDDLLGSRSSESAVVCREGALRLTDHGYGHLERGRGRILVDQVAEHLDAEISGP